MGRGRTKAVVVETRKRRPMRPEDEKPITPVAPPAPVRAAEPAPAPVQARPQQPTPAPRVQQGNNNQTNQRPPQQSHQPPRQNDRPRPVVLNHLSPEEMDARRRALADLVRVTPRCDPPRRGRKAPCRRRGDPQGSRSGRSCPQGR